MNGAVFDEVLLNTQYSALAQGGPQYPISLVRSRFSGLTQRNIDRDLGCGKWTISYGEMDATERADLLNFFRAGRGPSVPFRFLDGDDNTVAAEVFGTGDGFTQHFLLLVTYTRGDRSEVRRICKPAAGNLSFVPSPDGDNTITVFVGGTPTTAYVDSTSGIVFFPVAPANGAILTWSGQFHLPAYFSNEWYNPNLDTGGISEWSGIEIMECFPDELGLENPIGLVNWTSKVNVSQSAQGNKLTKTAATSAYDSGAASVDTIEVDNDGYVEAAAIETNKTRAIGLSLGNPGVTRDEIDFAIALESDGKIRIYESGTQRGTDYGSYAAGHRVRVQVENDIVTYWATAAGGTRTLLFTSAVAPVYPLLVDCSFFHQNATLASVVIGTQG